MRFTLGSAAAVSQIKSLGGIGKTLPTFIIQDPIRKLNYPFDDTTISTKVDVDSIQMWISNFLNGRLRPRVKSEENIKSLSRRHNHPHIVRVTGKTFKEIVLDKSKDVLVEFYDPNCDRCQAFQEIWELLGEIMCGVKTVVIAQMDAINNDVPPGKVG